MKTAFFTMVAFVLQSVAIAQNSGNITDTDNKVAAIKSALIIQPTL